MTSTTLYRFYDSKSHLLYVGISLGFLSRWGQHQQEKAWWHEIDHSRLEHFSSREAALLAEHRAIRDERPRFNIQSRGTRPFSVREEDDVLNSLFDFPGYRDSVYASFHAWLFPQTIGWRPHRFDDALTHLHAKGRVAITYSGDYGRVLLREPVTGVS